MYLTLDTRIPLRAGIHLATDIYLPEDDGPFPILICRTPYDKGMELYVEWATRFVQHGYGVLLQDCRGRYASEGEWTPYTDEANDGHDTVEWAGKQPWCDGNVGMFGISYVGFTQLLAALGGSRYLRAVMPTACQEDNFGHIWVDGVLQLQNAANFFQIGRRTMHPAVPERINMDRLYRTLPVSAALNRVADCPSFVDFLKHPTFDEYWSSYSLKSRYSHIAASTCLVTGWFDNLVHEQFKIFVGMRASELPDAVSRVTRLIVGPWTHFEIGERVVGDLDFGSEAAVDVPGLHMNWFDEQLRGLSPQGKQSPLRLFVMGDNLWRDEWEWPLERTVWKNLYLASDGDANLTDGSGRLSWDTPGDSVGECPDAFVYDPTSPTPTWGGQSMFLSNTGPRRREHIEARSDVLVYTSEPLIEDIEVTGPITLVLFAASDAVDTDFAATLVNVTQRGEAFIVSEGIVRGRYRESVVSPSLLTPHEIYRFEVVIWETAQVFHKGHRIRLEVSSSNFPRFDRNLNTGGAIGFEERMVTAQQRVFHDAERPSHLVLPVIPR